MEFNDEEVLPVHVRLFGGLSRNEVISLTATLTSVQ